MGDLLGSVAAIVASVVIIFTGWTPIDPILSVVVALLILRSAWRVVKESGHILLEGAPHGFDRREVATALTQDISGVSAVNHIHAWSVTQERPMITLEIILQPGADPQQIKQAVKEMLESRFGIAHSTVEVSFP